MGTTDLTPYSPRLLLQWAAQDPAARHRSIEGTLVFADVSGFTRLSERLARTRGKAGAEEMTEVIGSLFEDLLTVAARRGGEMLKYGGDAALLFFRGDDHALRAAAGAWEMQQRLREIGRVDTASGPVRLRMSVGMNSGDFDLFKVGSSHEELVIAGPATTETVRMETAANAGEILLSASTAATIAARVLGAEKEGGRLLRRAPDAPLVPIVTSEPSPHAPSFVAVGLRDHLGAGLVEPEHRLATVAFIHAMGLDGLLETRPATEVAEQLHETIRVVQDACAEFGVTFLATDLAADGTKVMAASGAPRAGDDDERTMLLALRRMVTTETPLPLRAGTNRGHVFAAAVGPSFRKTYTTMGDVTNTAARVMGRALAGEVLALAEVLDHTRVPFEVEQLEPFVAKGKAEPLVPYRVGDLAPESPPPATTRLPLVGRDAELAVLRDALGGARDGAGALVEVFGEMGTGKTRLIDEATTDAGDVAAIVVHCEPYHRANPFLPVRRLLLRAIGDAPAGVLETLTGIVRERVPNLQPWLPLLAAVFDVDIPDTDETRVLDPQYRLRRTAAVTVELLRVLLPRPTVVVVEDVHWLDDASAVVLRDLESAAPTTPWLVVVTRRDEPAAFVPTHLSTESLRLGALTEPEMRRLVAEATTGAPIPPHRRDAVVARAAGNPLFLTELLQSGGDGAVSDTLEAVMAAQIDRLPPGERRLLRHAAVLGSRFDLETLAALVEDPALRTAGARALTSRLRWLCIPEGPGQLRFRHQLIRDVAYESLPFRQRRDLHARAAEVLEQASTGEETAGLLSLHYERAQRHESCWHNARIAARRACEKYANVEAVELLERALRAARHLPSLDAAEVAETWNELGSRHALLGSLGEARAAFQRARRLTRDDPARLAMLCLREARAAGREGKSAAMLRWVRHGLRAVNGLEGVDERAVRADLLVVLGWAKFGQGRVRPAARLAEQALAEAEASANRRAVAYANTLLDSVDGALGRPPQPQRARTSLGIFRELGLLGEEAVTLNNLGMDAYVRGNWPEALRLFDQSRDAMTRIGNVIDAGYGTLNIAEILVEQGHLDQAETTLDELAPLWESVDHDLGLAYVDNHRGRIWLHRGEHERAIELLEAARSVFERNQLTTDALDAEARTAECLLRLGRVDEARKTVEAALDRDRGAGGTRVAARLNRVRAYIALVDGDTETAWAAMDQSLHVARTMASTYDLALALEGFDALAVSGGGPVGPIPEIDRIELLTTLGVVATPPPPLPDGIRATASLAVAPTP